MRRKRPRSSKVLFVLSVVVALGATLLLRGHLLRLEAAARETGPGGPIVVAETGLPRGTVLQASSLSVRSIPSTYRPPGAISSLEEAEGRTLAAEVLAGEPLTDARLMGEGGPVAAMVPPGLRAAPVAVSAPPGLLAPGDRVDVLATFAAGQPHTETVASAVEVLSILAGSTEAFEGVATLVLLVSPDVAETLAYARSFAELSVSVTSPEDVA
ncbi:MAG: Flp pilus assembly protein CpaB [Actinomycetota bacterium]